MTDSTTKNTNDTKGEGPELGGGAGDLTLGVSSASRRVGTKFAALVREMLDTQRLTGCDAWMHWVGESIVNAVVARNVQADGPDPRITTELLIAFGHAVLRREVGRHLFAETLPIPALAMHATRAVTRITVEIEACPNLFTYMQDYLAVTTEGTETPKGGG